MPIREPSSFRKAYAWHRAALADPDHPRSDGYPEAGWYQTKMVKGGPWVPVLIRIVSVTDDETGELTEPEHLVCEVDGIAKSPRTMERLWTHLRPISKAEYDSLVGRCLFDPAMSNPTKKINLMKEAIGPNG